MAMSLDVADALVATLERHGPLAPGAAAERLLALASGPAGLARRLLDAVVAEDARLVWRDGEIALAGAPWAAVPLAEGRFAVVDVETTGLDAGRDEITEAAVVVVERGRIVRQLELATAPGRPSDAVAHRILALSGDSILAGHNVAFDLRFLDGATARRRGARVGAAVVDTLSLARRLLAGRTERHSLPALASFFGTSSEPCHRALPDAVATAEILVRLLELASDRGLTTVGDLCAWGRPATPGGKDRGLRSII
jgi:DNA polymerase III epsilon subunit-like protein